MTSYKSINLKVSCHVTVGHVFMPPISLMSSPGGAGVYVQPHCGNWSSDDAQSLRYGRLGGQHITPLLFRIYEVHFLFPKSPVVLSVMHPQRQHKHGAEG